MYNFLLSKKAADRKQNKTDNYYIFFKKLKIENDFTAENEHTIILQRWRG